MRLPPSRRSKPHSVYLVYENPYFKVSAGNCVTSEEAIVLLGKIRSQFPEAYLMREDLTVADLIR